MTVLKLRNSAFVLVLAIAVASAVVTGCRSLRPLRSRAHTGTVSAPVAASEITLIEVARSERLWTGMAVSEDGRVFVNYPRWSDDVPFSVGEIVASGEVVPFPDELWNAWDGESQPGDHLVCVQSVYIDSDGFLWVLDAASAYLRGVVPGGAKLLKVDLAKDEVVGKIVFGDSIAPPASYLNDVRIDTKKRVAYVTDSGLGGLILVDLDTGTSRRRLGDHHSTKSEELVLTIGGRQWLVNGQGPQVHSDGLALDKDGHYLYYQALTGRTLYRIETRWLLDTAVSERELGTKVESMGETGAADGIIFGPGGYLYLSAIEDDAINIFASLGTVETVVKDRRLSWPDSFAEGPDGYLYVTTSQIHLGSDRTEPYRIFKLKPVR
jgi:sugar lactone lactonase YvrE